MAFGCLLSSRIFIVVLLIFAYFPIGFPSSLHSNIQDTPTNKSRNLKPDDQVFRLKRITEHLKKINKTPIKTIQSRDGDLIDCVLAHEQPAFDHPMLRGQKPLDPRKRPIKRYENVGSNNLSLEIFQLWHLSNETCPQGTIPIRRTKEDDIMRANSITTRFGRKPTKIVRRDSIDNGNGHEYAQAFINGKEYYGTKATINVWLPKVVNPINEFSVSQIWVISGTFGDDLNTIEAGWQVHPSLYGDNLPRLFTYWTSDSYKSTGCHNLVCSGFIQTNDRIVLGGAISPISSYNGKQFDITLHIWKDSTNGVWWLDFGSGIPIGYWPTTLFTHLQVHASLVQFGGEIINSGEGGFHTSTQMGSGHFPGEGLKKASFFRNLQVFDRDDNIIPMSDLQVWASNPTCYDIERRFDEAWGDYFFYGGPGRNERCS